MPESKLSRRQSPMAPRPSAPRSGLSAFSPTLNNEHTGVTDTAKSSQGCRGYNVPRLQMATGFQTSGLGTTIAAAENWLKRYGTTDGDTEYNSKACIFYSYPALLSLMYFSLPKKSANPKKVLTSPAKRYLAQLKKSGPYSSDKDLQAFWVWNQEPSNWRTLFQWIQEP